MDWFPTFSTEVTLMIIPEPKIKEWLIETALEQRRLVEARNVSDDEVEMLLANQGVISLPETRCSAASRPQPIQVSGKPVSETIIEERQ